MMDNFAPAATQTNKMDTNNHFAWFSNVMLFRLLPAFTREIKSIQKIRNNFY